MKILHIISQHPESTGSGYYLRNIVKCSANRDYTNGLVAGLSGVMEVEVPGVAKDKCCFIRFEDDGPDFTIPGMSDVMPYRSSRFRDLTEEELDNYEQFFATTMHKAVASLAPDLIHSHHLWLATAVARKEFPDIPLVTSCHSTDLRQFLHCPHIRNRVFEPCRSVDRILALSRTQKERIRQTFKIPQEKISVVGAGFDPAVFKRKEKHTAPPVELLYAGKLSYAKGLDRLLKVFTTMDNSDLHFHIAGSGSGEEYKTCLELAAKLPEKITVHGQIDQFQLAELMGRAHIFILPSWYEGLPLVLLEAISCGCRVITTELPGCNELLGGADEDHVRLLPLPAMRDIDRPEEKELPLFDTRLEDAIVDMANRVRRKAAPDRKATRQLIDQYTLGGFFSKIEKVYESVLSESMVGLGKLIKS